MGKWNGTPSPLWKLTEISIKEMLEAYQAGEPIGRICRRFDVTLNNIRYHARKAGIWKGKRPPPPLEERFWAKVIKTDTCWRWMGAKLPNGYGTIAISRQTVLVHRYSYELAKGPIPTDLVIDHLCRYRLCVNPEHLEAVTNLINVKRGMDFLGRPYELKNK